MKILAKILIVSIFSSFSTLVFSEVEDYDNTSPKIIVNIEKDSSVKDEKYKRRQVYASSLTSSEFQKIRNIIMERKCHPLFYMSDTVVSNKENIISTSYGMEIMHAREFLSLSVIHSTDHILKIRSRYRKDKKRDTQNFMYTLKGNKVLLNNNYKAFNPIDFERKLKSIFRRCM